MTDNETPVNREPDDRHTAGRRRGRWWRRLLVVFGIPVVVLFVVVAAAPSLLSTEAGRQWATGLANANIKGQARVADLSLSWFQPCLIHGVTLLDPQGREVLQVDRISWSPGLMRAAIDWRSLGDVEVNSADVDLLLDEEGSPSLAQALEPTRPREPKPDRAMPGLSARFILREGRVRVVSPEGREAEMRNIQADVQLGESRSLVAAISAVSSGGGALSLTVDSRGWMDPAGGLTVENARGEFALRTDKPLDLAPWLAVLGRSDIRSGTLDLDMQAKRDQKAASLVARLRTAGLVAVVDHQSRPVADASLDIEADWAEHVGWSIERANLKTAFASITGQGTATRATLEGTADLAAMRRELSPLFGDTSLPESGSLTFDVKANRDKTGNATALTLDASADNLVLNRGDSSFAARSITVHHEGDITERLENGRRQAVIRSKGSLRSGGLQVDGAPLGDGSLRTDWEGAQFATNNRQINLTKMTLTSGFLTLNANDIEASLAEVLSAQGSINGRADLAQLQRAASPWLTMESQYAGAMQFSAVGRAGADRVDLDFDAQIDDLVIAGVGEEPFREKRVEMSGTLEMIPSRQITNVEAVELDSEPLDVQAVGKIRDCHAEGPCTLDIQGNYTGSWDRMTQLLHNLAPATRETISFAGQSSGEFILTGPARSLPGRPAKVELTGSTTVGWGSARAYGLNLGTTSLTPSLTQGMIVVPDVDISANNGTIRPGAMIDITGETPRLLLPGQHTVLEDVALTPELTRELLGRINPLLAQAAEVSGLVTLRLEDLDIPLGEQARTTGSGAGELILENFTLQPTGVLAALLGLLRPALSRSESLAIGLQGARFRIRNGQIVYDDLAMILPGGQRLAFSGSVDMIGDAVNLAVNVPVTEQVLSRAGVSGPVAEYARLLGDATVAVPIGGTRSQPTLNLPRVNIQPLVEEAGRKLLAEQARRLLEGAIGPSENPTTQPADAEAAPPGKPSQQRRPERRRRQPQQ